MYLRITMVRRYHHGKRIAVWVLKGNDKAIRFYERYGFRFDGTESEIELGTPNTEIRMVYDKHGLV